MGNPVIHTSNQESVSCLLETPNNLHHIKYNITLLCIDATLFKLIESSVLYKAMPRAIHGQGIW